MVLPSTKATEDTRSFLAANFAIKLDSRIVNFGTATELYNAMSASTSGFKLATLPISLVNGLYFLALKIHALFYLFHLLKK